MLYAAITAEYSRTTWRVTASLTISTPITQEEGGLHEAVTSTIKAPIKVYRPFPGGGKTHFDTLKVAGWEEGHQAEDAGQRKEEYWEKKKTARAGKRKAALGDLEEDSQEETEGECEG